MKTIHEKFYKAWYPNYYPSLDTNEYIWEFTEPSEIVRKFNWKNKSKFVNGEIDSIYMNCSEPILAVADEKFYTVSDNEYVGNLGGVIAYLHLQEHPKDLDEFKKMCHPIYQRFANYLIDKEPYTMDWLRMNYDLDLPGYALAYHYSNDNYDLWHEFLDCKQEPIDSVDIFEEEKVPTKFVK